MDGALSTGRIVRIGLTGGIGSGKSAVSERWRVHGAVIVDADLLARQVVAPGSPGLAEIAAAWPSAISADGSLDRPALAAHVFSDATARARLNAIVHPRVRALAAACEAEQPDGAIVVQVIPLLFESDYDAAFDCSVLVVAPDGVRLERVQRRDGLPYDAVQARMAAQIDPELARTKATYVIENDADEATLHERADAVLREITARYRTPERTAS